MKKIGIFITIAIGVLLIAMMLYFSDIGSVINVVMMTDLSMLLLSLPFVLLSMLSRNLRWWYILRKEMSLRLAIALSFVGVLVNRMLPSKLGGVLKIVLTKKIGKVDLNKSVSSVVLDNIIEISFALIMSFLMVVVVIADFPRYLENQIIAGCLLFALVLALFYLATLVLKSSYVTKKLLGRLKFNNRVLNRLGNFPEQFKLFMISFIKNKKLVIVSFVCSSLAYIFFFIFNYLIAKSLSIQISWTYLALASTFPIAFGILTLLPGGLGTQDISMAGILVAGGLTMTLATSIVLLSRFLSLIVEITFGALSSYYLGIKMVKEVNKL